MATTAKQETNAGLYNTLLAGIVLALLGYLITDIRDMKADISQIKNDISELKVEVSTKQNKAHKEELPLKDHTYFVKAEGININRRRYAVPQ